MNVNLKFFLKDTIRKMVDFSQTAQNQGLPPPPLQKPYPAGAALIPLARPGEWTGVGAVSVAEAIARRKSHRSFRQQLFTMDELSFLLWATQGLRKAPGESGGLRTVPSAGCRHAFETYLAVYRVRGLEPALYRYLPVEHALVETARLEHLDEEVALAAYNQGFVSRGAATFFWTALPERMEWRYAEASYKVMALDAGHVCQNLYLACEAVGAGTCAIAAYDQEACDRLLGLDGETEFTLYLAPVGKV
ncbi:SagB/ThcOx family dehydrogenase [Desulfovibrio aerotolerans]|uniref:SagB/ThcOx family dehydrogenase n=1 Tax=Solidesulfovibrio aerotolerans TaxID=295255 RepID=A0A7C9MGN4_9BACT|nr:SagB/ThcOx family dehydrogenase [Solidesulfovibrio aerotolerans]MYL82028.1 SagB/ThcOx family dehydrogenase [Solidesulfovibrio aerotolerans]